MKLAQLKSSATTSVDLIYPPTGLASGVIVEGFTPDSVEWKAAEKQLVKPGDEQSLVLEKGRTRLPLDSNAKGKKDALLRAVITNISGIDGWEYSPDAAAELLADPGCSWMLEQWGEHLDDRTNFFKRPVKTVQPGLKT